MKTEELFDASGSDGRNSEGDAKTQLTKASPTIESVGLITAWSVFTTALIIIVRHHEPWFDEGHAWLIARDSSLHDMIFEVGRYNGTPALWYVTLWSLVKLKLPYVAMSYLSVALASCAAAFFLRFAPFPPVLRVLSIFGYFPAYQYSVVARSYVFNVLLLWVAAFLFQSRLIRPLAYCFVLVILANTNAYGFIAAVVLFSEFVLMNLRSRPDVKKLVLPVSLFVIAATMAVLQARRAPDSSFVLESYSQFSVMREIASSLVFALAVFRLVRTAGHAALLTALCGAQAGFALVIYAQAHHTGLIYLSWMFAVWVSWPALPRLSDKDRRIVLVTFTLILCLQLYDTMAAWMLDFRYPYSAAPAAATQLRRYLKASSHPKLACVGFGAFAVQPYFDRNMCDNYYGGRPKPAFYDLKKNDPTPLTPDSSYLGEVLQSRTFDLVLVSDFIITQSEANTAAVANGYCAAAYYRGKMIWKDGFFEDDDLMLFRKFGE